MVFSTLSSLVLLLVKAVDSYGCDGNALLEEVGLDPAKLRDPNARLPYPPMVELWALAKRKTKDPCLGLTAAQFWHPTTLHGLGYSWFASECLREALSRMVRFTRIMHTGIEARLEETELDYQLIVDDSKVTPRLPDEAFDALFSIVVAMCRISYGPSFSPLRVVMRRAPPDCADRFSEFFRAPFEFSASENSLAFGKATLNTLLPTANAELARASDQIVTEYLAHLDRSDIAALVKAELINKLPSGETTEEPIAEALNMSLRSMQRKLKEANTSYKEILDETRCELAELYIRNSQITINEITFLLGFSEPSNFSRAFKRWKGLSPRAYRQGN